MKIVHPKIPKSKDLRRKLSGKDIHKMKILKKQKVTEDEIAKIMQVNKSTVRYWTRDSERNYQIKKIAKIHKDRPVKKYKRSEYGKKYREHRKEVIGLERIRKYFKEIAQLRRKLLKGNKN